jgi:hypothetical protein
MRSLLIVFGCTLLVACGIFKSAPERPHRPSPSADKPRKIIDHPKEEKERENAEKDSSTHMLDSVLTGSDLDTPQFRKKDQYTLQLILPLVPFDEGGLIEKTESNQTQEDRSDDPTDKILPFNLHFIEYVSGFSLAMDEARKLFPTFNYRLHLKSSGDFDAKLTGSEKWSLSPKPDVVLGGIRPESIDRLTSLSAEHGFYYISPWITSKPFSENPLFLQLTPGLEEYCLYMADQVARDSGQSKLTLVTSPEFEDRLRIFTTYFETQYPSLDYQPFVIDRFKAEDKTYIQLPERMRSDSTHIVILAMDRNESYLYEALSFFANAEEWQGSIFGFSSWKNYPLLYEFFEKGNVYLVSHTSAVHHDSTFLAFEKMYYDSYRDLPSSWAVKGYDHGMFIAEGLVRYGLDFYGYLDEISYQGVDLFFKFPSQQDEQLEGLPMLPITNEGVKLLHYKDYIFQAVNK